MTALTIECIKLLKGAPLGILILLYFCPEPVSQSWIERWSGYSDKTVSQACHLLNEMGLLIFSPDGWILSEDICLPNHPRKNSGPGIISIIDLDLKDLNNNSNTNNNSPRKNSDPQPAITALTPFPLPPAAPPAIEETPEKKELWQVLRESGIYRNDRTRALLKLPHITPQYMRDKLEEYKNRELEPKMFTGLVIRAMESGEPPVARAPNGHLVTCKCQKCELDRFAARR